MNAIQSAIQARMQAQQTGNTEWLKDGDLHVVLVGTGCPLYDPNRAGPCTAVIADGDVFLVDVGPGAWDGCTAASVPAGTSLSAVLLTHFHSDHMGELGEVMTQSWINYGEKRDGNLAVYGPPGVEEVVDGFNMAYKQDFKYREDHHSRAYMPATNAGVHAIVIDVPEAEGDAMWDQEAVVMDKSAEGGMKITAFHVDHRPVKPAYGYKFYYRGRSVVVSGDTAKCASVVHQSRGADLLVHEACACHLLERASKAMADMGNARRARLAQDVIDYHAAPQEIVDICKETGVQHLAFTHIVPPIRNIAMRQMWLQGLDTSGWDGNFVVGEDGMHFSLPEGPSTDVTMASGFPPSMGHLAAQGAFAVLALYWLAPRGGRGSATAHIASVILSMLVGARVARI